MGLGRLCQDGRGVAVKWPMAEGLISITWANCSENSHKSYAFPGT